LVEAASQGQESRVRELLKSGIHVDDNSGSPLGGGSTSHRTALLWAAECGHMNVVQVLLEARANVDAQSGDGDTALIYAVLNQDVDMVQTLIQAGANQHIGGRFGCTALSEARDNVAIVAMLDTLGKAAHRGDLNTVKRIIAAGINPNCDIMFRYGFSPLWVATHMGHTSIVIELLGANADVQTVNPKGSTTLHEACGRGHQDIAQKLIEAKADVSATKSTNGETPLHWAAEFGKLQCAQLLLDAKADASMPNTKGDTALKVAEQEQRTDIANLLRAPQHPQVPDWWSDKIDPLRTCVELLPRGNERDRVTTAFMSSLSGRGIEVVDVQRVQSLSMWLSYQAKRQSILLREAHGGSTAAAESRYERVWLFHGTDEETVPKIMQQGFNRSFCGKNATRFGKGVYFARNASYSSSTRFSQPNKDRIQHMFLCRVIIGEYCCGVADAIVPPPRDGLVLFDSTVDDVSAPDIFVTYHDSQAYPEYLVRFRQ